MPDLISIDEARRRVLHAARPLEAEEVALAQANGRVLAGDIESRIPTPPFDSSAMDGFAVVAGPAADLDVVDESRAGHPASRALDAGAAMRISTGATVPEGATAVVPVERSEPHGDRVRVPDTVPGQHIRRAGEDVRAGDLVLRVGTTLGPAELALAASVGWARLPCAVRPRVAVLVTGDELTEPGEPLRPGKIYSSNGIALAAQVERAGALLTTLQTVGDSRSSTRDCLERALDEADVVCVSGGVSVGPHDHVKPALAELGVEEAFWGVSLQPGKPTWFGTRQASLVFGLPGNPVSVMVTFQLFVRPALAALQGADPQARRASAVLDAPLRRNAIREQAVRVRLQSREDGWHATHTGPQGSHMITSMLGADALALVAPGEGEAAAGERVEIELL